MINGGGIPQSNDVLNQVYASVFGWQVLVPSKSVVGPGWAIFAFVLPVPLKPSRKRSIGFALSPDVPCGQIGATHLRPVVCFYLAVCISHGASAATAVGGEILPALIALAEFATQ